MPQSLARVLVHVIFSTKNREPYIVSSIRAPLHAYLAKTLIDCKCPVIAINGTGDHVHLLFSLHRTKAVSEMVRTLKAASTKWIRDEFASMDELGSFQWQGGYGVFSVSESNSVAVKAYIDNQESHHKEMSFRDEYEMFLQKHGVSFDESYVWD